MSEDETLTALEESIEYYEDRILQLKRLKAGIIKHGWKGIVTKVKDDNYFIVRGQVCGSEFGYFECSYFEKIKVGIPTEEKKK